MRTFLVVDKLQMAPGVYGAKLSDEAKEFITKFKPYKFFRVDKALKKIKAMQLKHDKASYDLLKIDDLSKLKDGFKSQLPFGGDDMIYFTNSLLIKNEIRELNESLFLFYNEQFFEGCFESEEHFKLIFPSNKNAELIIIDREFVEKHFKGTKNIEPGLNVELHNLNSLVPLKDISENSWTHLTVLIQDVFDYLGAKEIHIRDTTDVNATVEVDYKKLKSLVNADIKVDLTHDFKLDKTYTEGIYEPEATEHQIPILEKYAPQFAQTAKELKKHKRKGTFHIDDKIDVSFGVSVNVVAVFQGAFKGGFKRNFEMTVTFG